MSRSSVGQSIVLSSTLALLSYVPFEIVAKVSLSFCAFVFVFDPIPPVSRIIALVGVLVVGLLGKVERKWKEGQIDLEEELKEKEGEEGVEEEEEEEDQSEKTPQTLEKKKDN